MKSQVTIVPFALLSILSLTSCDDFAIWRFNDLAKIASAAESKALPEVVTHEVNPDVFAVNGEFDFCHRVAMKLKNNGQQGPIIVNVVLSTSEGEWTRNQTVTMSASETKELAYVFTEPTVNASNIEYSITTLP